MPITGDHDRLAAIGEALRAASVLPRRISESVAVEFEAELEAQYAGGFDPNNEAWAELSAATLARGRTPPPLTDRGVMRRNSKAVAGVGGVAGVTVRVTRPGGNPAVPNFHQEGTEWMPDRKIVPEQDRPLPPAWKAAAERGAAEVVVDHFEGL